MSSPEDEGSFVLGKACLSPAKASSRAYLMNISQPTEADGLQYSIIVPVFNEEEVIGRLLAELRKVLDHWRPSYELWVVDDGSSDRTGRIVKEFFTEWPEANLAQLSRNSGQAAALFHGMKLARGAKIILMDGDGQNDPGDIPRLVSFLDDCDMIVGIRVKRRDSLLRLLMSRLANSVRRRLLKDGVSDTGCGLKAFHRHVVAAFIPIQTLYSFMPALASSAGFSIREMPVHHRPRLGGKSKYGLRKFLWRPFLDLLGVWWFGCRRCPIEPVQRSNR
ncbi:MAG: glycosyltransferase family 2 protein [Verrucomicrobia bacterium]|nr:glycosyltransferase family 2 protein [Verrucomicrobiota bacterium]MBV9674465.1 glycosyltransferase family 2 protein [Verrucomicrobiota bacterium]